ncbi:dihydrofolate reductase [Candidatus Saccharibacteria bacterium]|nr:dihydrofolate reductase [Candidatus Saccharibacteria bacterium]
MFSIIAAVGKNNELGKKGDLIFHIKEDMQFFKETTTGHTVVMGFKTWESLPKKLPNRKNIVVSFEEIEGPDECVTDLVQFIKDNENTNEEIFVIGGGSIYAQFIDHAKRIYLTEINGEDSEADVFFPTFDKSKYKRTVLQKGNSGKLSYEMCRYEV